jgi:hypothetical protein
MELEHFFGQILKLSYPYKVIRVDQKESLVEAVHIYIKADKKYQPENTESNEGKRHDKEARIWRHLDLFQYPLKLQFSSLISTKNNQIFIYKLFCSFT